MPIYPHRWQATCPCSYSWFICWKRKNWDSHSAKFAQENGIPASGTTFLASAPKLKEAFFWQLEGGLPRIPPIVEQNEFELVKNDSVKKPTRAFLPSRIKLFRLQCSSGDIKNGQQFQYIKIIWVRSDDNRRRFINKYQKNCFRWLEVQPMIQNMGFTETLFRIVCKVHLQHDLQPQPRA